MDKATQSARGGQGDFITNGLYRRATVLRILGIDERDLVAMDIGRPA